jgi:acetyl esterase/lipase
LRAAGVAVTLNDTRGTRHGFDIVKKAPLARAAVAARIAFMKKMFYGEDSASD